MVPKTSKRRDGGRREGRRKRFGGIGGGRRGSWGIEVGLLLYLPTRPLVSLTTRILKLSQFAVPVTGEGRTRELYLCVFCR